MTPEQIKEARAAMVLPGWRWLPGMQVINLNNQFDRGTINSNDGWMYWGGDGDFHRCVRESGRDFVPDITHARTAELVATLANGVSHA